MSSAQHDAWYVVVNGQSYGPYSHQRLKEFIINGKLVPQSQVYASGMQNTIPASQIPGLAFPVVEPIAPPVEPPISRSTHSEPTRYTPSNESEEKKNYRLRSLGAGMILVSLAVFLVALLLADQNRVAERQVQLANSRRDSATMRLNNARTNKERIAASQEASEVFSETLDITMNPPTHYGNLPTIVGIFGFICFTAGVACYIVHASKK